MRGRRPKPTHLKVLQGDAGKRGVDQDAVVPEIVAPEPPELLEGDALEEWNRISVELEALGMIGKIDRAILAAYCKVYARWIAAERALDKTSLIVRTPSGYPMHNPLLAVANKCIEQMRALGSEFGMSPAARSRIKGSVQLSLPLGDEDEFGKFLNGKKTG